MQHLEVQPFFPGSVDPFADNRVALVNPVGYQQEEVVDFALDSRRSVEHVTCCTKQEQHGADERVTQNGFPFHWPDINLLQSAVSSLVLICTAWYAASSKMFQL